MNSNKLILQLALNFKSTYFVLLLLYPIILLPTAATGLIAKSVFDILQGAESISIVFDSVSINVGPTNEQKIALTFSLIGILVLMHVIHVLPHFTALYYLAKQQFQLTSLLQRNMLFSLYRRPGADGLPQSPGEAISRFRGDPLQIAGFIFSSQNLFASALVGSIAFAILLSVSQTLTLIVFVPLVLIVGAAHIASAKIQKYREASRKTTGDVTHAIGEFFSGIQAIQVAGAEACVMEHFRDLNEKRREAGLKDLLFNNVLEAVFGGVSTIGLGIVLLLVGKEMRSGAFSAGDFALYQYYLFWMMGLPATLGTFLIGAQQSKVAVDRMQQIMGNDSPNKLVEFAPTYLWGEFPKIPPVAKHPQDRLDHLEVSGLTYTYDGDKGIRDINLSIKKGSVTVVCGNVGSGKSTLLRTLLGLLPAESGKIYWNGEPVEFPDTFFVPPHSAYIPQVPHLYSDSVRDNILMGMQADKLRLDEVLRRAAIEDFEHTLDNGLDTLIGPKGVRLSGGQQQRVAAARMFIRDAEILVCDDLSSALDNDTETKIWTRLLEARDSENRTYLIVSHRPTILKHADHIVVIKDGTIVDEGTPRAMLAESKELAKVILTQ